MVSLSFIVDQKPYIASLLVFIVCGLTAPALANIASCNNSLTITSNHRSTFVIPQEKQTNQQNHTSNDSDDAPSKGRPAMHKAARHEKEAMLTDEYVTFTSSDHTGTLNQRSSEV